MAKPSAYLTATWLRQVLYGILLKDDVETIADENRDESSKACYVEEYDRENKKQVCNIIKPVYDVPLWGTVPSLSSIPEMSLQDRLDFIFRVLDMNGHVQNDFKVFNSSVQFILAVVMYVVRRAHTKLTVNQLRALIVSMLKVSCLTSGAKQTACLLKGEQDLVCGEPVGKEEVTHAQENLKKFCTPPKQAPNHGFDVSVIHAYSQVQACFLSAMYLNKLVSCPFPAVNPACVFNGTFLYNFCQELRVRANPDLYIAEMLGRNSILNKTYMTWMDFIISHVASDAFATDGKMLAAKKSKKRSSKDKVLTTNVCSDDNEIENDGMPEAKPSVVAACQLSNRFADLLMDDSDDIGDSD